MLEMSGVQKRYGSTQALAGVSFRLEAGEVHALVGENGAGKSTLMKILAGAERPDAGEMFLGGAPYAPRGPREARELGVAMIYQELAIAPHLTVEANILLGREPRRGGWLRASEARRIVSRVLGTLDHPEIKPETRCGDLSVAAQQLVEVARALVSDARVIVFDEPTSALTRHDVEVLFDRIARLRERGIGIVYISHFLEEVARVAQRYTVLRDGRSVATGDVAGMTPHAFVSLMVGREIHDLFPRTERTPGEIVLELEALAGRPLPREASLALRRGEVVGIAGLVGTGRTELLRLIYGLDPVRSGAVRVAAWPSSTRAGPRSRIEQGLGFLSEDRKTEGLALDRSIEENLSYSALRRHARWGWLKLRARRQAAKRWADALGVRAATLNQPVRELSGGNQQKVALGRLLHQEADILLLDEPTRGVDVGSKVEIYRWIDRLAAEGKSVLMVSSYLPELLGVSDRIAVMSRGKLGPARPVAEWTEASILSAATGL
jgi:ribose transport system ATP-binding protein